MRHHLRPEPADSRAVPEPEFRRCLAAALFGLLALASARTEAADPASAAANAPRWAASWATAIQSAYVAPTGPQGPAIPAYDPQPDLSFALPNGTVDGAENQTFRMVIRPDLWGPVMRVRFSNAFGTRPVTVSAAAVALRERDADLVPGTTIPVSFGGGRGLTIQPGRQAFSDPVVLPFVNPATIPLLRGRDLAVSFAVSGSTGPASWHANAFSTSYISPPNSGDRTAATDGTAFPFSTTGFFFLSELDVLAPAGTRVIVAFGDSITDGTASTLNGSDRWADVMVRRLHGRYGDAVSVVNEGIAGNGVTNALVGQAATQRASRDLLGLSGLTDVVWLEGINDLTVAGSPPATIEDGYRQVVAALHAAGTRVIGATLTSTYPPGGVVPPNSPLAGGPLGAVDASQKINGERQQLNAFITGVGLFDGVADFAAATTDPTTGSLRAAFVPNSEGCAGDNLHPNRAGYAAMGITAADAVSRLSSAVP